MIIASLFLSEWGKVPHQHEICRDQIIGNNKKILDLQKQIKIMQEQVYRQSHWSLVVAHTEEKPNSPGLDLMKIYRALCSLQRMTANR